MIPTLRPEWRPARTLPSSPGPADVSAPVDPSSLNAHFDIGDRDADVSVTEGDGAQQCALTALATRTELAGHGMSMGRTCTL